MKSIKQVIFTAKKAFNLQLTMKAVKVFNILFALIVGAAINATAQNDIEVTRTSETQWSYDMPNSDVRVKATYATEVEVAVEMHDLIKGVYSSIKPVITVNGSTLTTLASDEILIVNGKFPDDNQFFPGDGQEVSGSPSLDWTPLGNSFNMYMASHLTAGVTNTCTMEITYKKVDSDNNVLEYGTASTTFEVKDMFAEYSEEGDEKILTFKVGVKPAGANYFDFNAAFNLPAWSSKTGDLTKVVFDESFKIARPTVCSMWFNGGYNIKEFVGWENFNTSKVEYMDEMFASCSLTVLDLSHFDTENVMNMDGMFESCNNLTTILVSEYNATEHAGWTTKSVTTYENLFGYCCQQLIGNQGTTYDSENDYKTYARIDGDETPGYLTTGDYKIFYKWADDETGAYQAYTPSTYNNSTTPLTIENPTRAGYQFLNWTRVSANGTQIGGSSASLTIAAGDLGNRIYKMHWAVPYAEYIDGGKTLTFKYGEKPDGAYSMNTPADMPDWSMYGSEVTKVVFDETFAAARPTSCAYWFRNMTKLNTIEGIDNLNTSSVKNMAEMFSGCSSLTSLNLSHFNTEKDTSMCRMFQGCSSLTSLVFSSDFNTESVTNMEAMFYDCSSLTTLNLSDFNTRNVENMISMFYNCSGLTTILIDESQWSTTNVEYSYDMFGECTSLIGNDGTTYDSEVTDKTNAHADAGGYFTTGNYKIFFDADALDATMDDCATCATNSKDYIYTEYSDDFTPPTMTRSAYTFKGWKRILDYEGNIETEITETVSKNAGNRWFKAQWEELPKYTVVLPEDFTASPNPAYAGENITVTYSGSSQIGGIKLVPLPTTITITPPSNFDMVKDLTETLTADIYPDLPEVNKAVKWTSNKPEVVSVTETSELQTIITSHAFGRALITATTVKNNKSASVWVLCCAPNPTYYVDPVSGDDDNDGVSEATAFKTFDAVLSCMINNVREYTVILKGEYTDAVTFDSYEAKSLTVRGIGSGTDYLNTTVTTSDNSIIFENIKIKQLSGGAVLNSGAVVEKVTTASNLTVSGSAKAGNVTLNDDAKIIIAGELSAETVATITPSNYNNQVVELADGVTDTKIAWERDRFVVTPSGSNYYYVQDDGKLSRKYSIDEENDEAHPYILKIDDRRTSGNYSPEVDAAETITDATTDKSFYITFDNWKRVSDKWSGCINFFNYNVGTTFTYYVMFEGTNSSSASEYAGINIGLDTQKETTGNIKLVFGSTTTGTLTFTDGKADYWQHPDFEVRGTMSGTLTFEVAPGCTFSGTVGSTTYTDITEFFTASQSHKGGSTMTITKN